MSNETNFPNNSNHPQSANIPVSSLTPFTRFCCSLGMIPASYKASMSYEEQLMWLCNYLENTVIPTVNNNTDVTNEVQELFNELHDYVENYFTNLDVQQEINNKLDTMAEDGTLISIIAPYLQPFINEQNQTISNAINQQNNRITQVENFVYASTNINPLVASSTSDMTDTTRIYVNTTDGYWYYYNGTQWTQGGIYQASVDSSSIDEINYKIEQIGNPSVNLFDKSKITDGKFYKRDSTTHKLTTEDNNDYYCYIFPIFSLGEYTLSAVSYQYLFCDDELNVLFRSSTYSSTEYNVTVNTSAYTNTKYIAFSVRKNATVSIDNFMIAKGTTLPTSYIPFKFTLKDNISLSATQYNEVIALLNPENITEQFVVDINGNGDFTSLTQCLKSLQNNTNNKKISILSGVYDIFEEYGGQEWHQDEENQDKSYTELCVWIPKNTIIEGVGDVTLKYHPSSSQTTVAMSKKISVLNIRESCIIKNLKIDAYNCRYAIHEETGSNYINQHFEYHNLLVEKGRTNANYGFGQALGFGGTVGTFLLISNCIIKSSSSTFSTHDSGTDAVYGMTIFFNNSTFISGSGYNAIRLSNINATNKHKVYINNCYFEKLSLEYESSNSAQNGYDVTISNCNNYDLYFKYDLPNQYPIKNYNTEILSITNGGEEPYVS